MCKKMLVKELIEILKEFPQDHYIFIVPVDMKKTAYELRSSEDWRGIFRGRNVTEH